MTEEVVLSEIRKDVKALVETVTNMRVEQAKFIGETRTKMDVFEHERDILRQERWQTKVALATAVIGPVVVYFLR
jgi:hypothetical protein